MVGGQARPLAQQVDMSVGAVVMEAPSVVSSGQVTVAVVMVEVSAVMGVAETVVVTAVVAMVEVAMAKDAMGGEVMAAAAQAVEVDAQESRRVLLEEIGEGVDLEEADL